MRTQLNHLHQIIAVVNALRQRHIEHRARWLAQLKARELRIAHYADNPVCAGIFGHINTEMLVEGIFIAFEESLHERFVDKSH